MCMIYVYVSMYIFLAVGSSAATLNYLLKVVVKTIANLSFQLREENSSFTVSSVIEYKTSWKEDTSSKTWSRELKFNCV